jgi:hypothetical protein
LCVGLSPDSVKQSIRPDLLSALQLRADFALSGFRNLLDLLTQTKSDALTAHVITQSFGNLEAHGLVMQLALNISASPATDQH